MLASWAVDKCSTNIIENWIILYIDFNLSLVKNIDNLNSPHCTGPLPVKKFDINAYVSLLAS